MKKQPRVIGFTWTLDDARLITERETWGDVLVEEARRDPSIVALSADLSRTTKMARFRQEFPERFFNVGVAEQNLVAVASGLASVGLRPVICTYAMFASLRAAEFVRTDLAYNQRQVVVVGQLAGVAFGQGGPTHQALEDLALLRAIPGLTVLAPCDGYEAGALLRQALSSQGPTYIRMGRGSDPAIHEVRDPDVRIGRAHVIEDGDDATILACGPCVHDARNASRRARRRGISVRVLDMHTIKPLDEGAVVRAARETGVIVTAEDHAKIGGLGSAVAEVLAHSGLACRVRALGHPDRFLGAGVPEDLMHASGVDEDGMLAALGELLGVPPFQVEWAP